MLQGELYLLPLLLFIAVGFSRFSCSSCKITEYMVYLLFECTVLFLDVSKLMCYAVYILSQCFGVPLQCLMLY